MIHLFNRKELLTTWDMEVLAKVRDILASNNMDYVVKTVNRTSPSPFAAGSRGRTGAFGIRTDAMYQYIIYVKNTDYQKARFLIGK